MRRFVEGVDRGQRTRCFNLSCPLGPRLALINKRAQGKVCSCCLTAPLSGERRPHRHCVAAGIPNVLSKTVPPLNDDTRRPDCVVGHVRWGIGAGRCG